ncbi:MAG TPA: B-box zinc finger protein [Pyrinomonadaceae bacterium]
MSEPGSTEIWQVEVNGQVYDAAFGELADWIAEGSLVPEDKVRRGNLRWIEARKVPTLVPFFNAKATGMPMPPVITTTVAEPEPLNVETEVAAPEPTVTVGAPTVAAVVVTQPANDPVSPSVNSIPVSSVRDPNCCANHAERVAAFQCQTCGLSLCRDCVKTFGSSVLLCSACGGMAKPKTQVQAEQRTAEFRSQSITKGFGFADFGEALAYPFKFKTSLFFGALMYTFFSMGKLASAMGGMYMIAAALMAYMLANMLVFGILANTIESFAHGKIGGNFMPSFDDFELWDDVIHPFFLYIGTILSSFGPFILVFALGSWMVIHSMTAQAEAIKSQVEHTPGTPDYTGIKDTLDQSEQVKSILGNSNRINQQHLDQQEQLEKGQAPTPPVVDDTEESVQRVNGMIAESKKKELEGLLGKSAETRAKEQQTFISGLLRVAAPLVVIGFITFLWGLFYFPAASTVAGYTRSFVATLNPMVGLDTIKRLGFDYVKILCMGFLLLVAAIVVSFIAALIFSPFDLPGMGNIPAQAIGSLFQFYLWIVFACILGFAMFKASDRLRLSR